MNLRQATSKEVQTAMIAVAKGIFVHPDHILILLHESQLEDDNEFKQADPKNKTSLYLAPGTASDIADAKLLRAQRFGHPILRAGDNIINCTFIKGDTAFLDHGFADQVISAIPLTDGWLAVVVHHLQVLFTVTTEASNFLNDQPVNNETETTLSN